MKKTNRKLFFIGVSFLLSFILWTILVKFVDVKSVGPNESAVGFATLNTFFHKFTGTNLTLYNITDWFGLVPIALCLGFAILGLTQWIKRKDILKVDFSILILGIFYIVVIAVYILFEYLVINYRPILINGYLEASYPSSTTLLVMCVMPTAIMQLNSRIKNRIINYCITTVILVFTLFMVIGRLISGVHWLSDIIGGGLFSTGIVILYYWLCEKTAYVL